ncbi:unnamed protein product [Kuraishia capsulata CBS 1993]|uniref:Major facilitator superfamily (MFS) profile domain-containing protein n=1 Tax=Kuraishia capsulata CBS 1993 TaxID=1382522 RepID=W6MHK6_9ASCO|nr:uncharacterized protein KUCA_T00001175001 [Kuraishia capsulata CBS 1993]CDK25208.1 unnamed protein product [Kuraishia capsulata CBS 1993]
MSKLESEIASKENSVEVNDVSEVDSSSSQDLSEHHIFQDPVVAEHYRKLYEETQYECRTHFDPDFKWTAAEEKKVKWKTEWHVVFWSFIMFTALDFDRNNLSQALSDNMLDDLGITTNDYNLGLTLNKLCFLIAELPSQLVSKRIGSDVWVPTQIVLFSIIAMTQAALKNRAGFLATRCLLGFFQGGFDADLSIWISYFYKNSELPMRYTLFYAGYPLTNIWSSLLSFAILRLRGHKNWAGWQWLFLIEGAFTLVIGFLSYFLMPASAVQTRKWYRPKGWYTDREEKIVVNRVLRDDPSKGDMHNRRPVTPKELWKGLCDYDMWPLYVLRIMSDIGSAPVSAYMTLTLRKLGFSTLNTNLLSIPYNVLNVITMVTAAWFSQKFNEYSLIFVGTSLWVLACLFPLRYWPGSQVNVWPTYAILTIVIGHPQLSGVSISWTSANAGKVRVRTVAAAVVTMFSQLATIVSSQLYRDDDKPLYHRGNLDLIGIAFGAIAVGIITKFYYIWRNKKREEVWSQMTIEQKEEYITTTTDEGNKRLDFRFKH